MRRGISRLVSHQLVNERSQLLAEFFLPVLNELSLFFFHLGNVFLRGLTPAQVHDDLLVALVDAFDASVQFLLEAAEIGGGFRCADAGELVAIFGIVERKWFLNGAKGGAVGVEAVGHVRKGSGVEDAMLPISFGV